MPEKKLKYIFESMNLQYQRKLHHSAIIDANPHNLCNRNEAQTCEIEIRQSGLS